MQSSAADGNLIDSWHCLARELPHHLTFDHGDCCCCLSLVLGRKREHFSFATQLSLSVCQIAEQRSVGQIDRSSSIKRKWPLCLRCCRCQRRRPAKKKVSSTTSCSERRSATNWTVSGRAKNSIFSSYRCDTSAAPAAAARAISSRRFPASASI